MHLQPVVCTFLNGQLDCCFFERDGELIRRKRLVPKHSDCATSDDDDVPSDFARVKIHHICRNDISLLVFEDLKTSGKGLLEHYNETLKRYK